MSLRALPLVLALGLFLEGRGAHAIYEAAEKRSRKLSEAWESKLNDAVAEREELVEHVRKLEEDYDNEVFDSQMDDLKDLLHRQGIRLD